MFIVLIVERCPSDDPDVSERRDCKSLWFKHHDGTRHAGRGRVARKSRGVCMNERGE